VSVRIFRVTVRGFFRDLEPEVRDALLAVADEHEPLRAAFTEGGTFTYEQNLTAFSFRFERRENGDDDDGPAELAAQASSHALDRATTFLHESRIGHKELRVQVTDMADVWND
jgi:hypothetical protein